MDSNKAQNNHAKEGYYEIKRIGTLVVKDLQLKMEWSKFKGTWNKKLLKVEVKWMHRSTSEGVRREMWNC